MASKPRSGATASTRLDCGASDSSLVDLVSAPHPPLAWSARFLHGSPDSRDVDCVYVLDDRAPFPTHSELVEFCRSDTEDKNVVQLGFESDTGAWYVKRSFRGAPDEVNNALLATARVDPSGPQYDFLVTKKCARHVLLRYTIAAKAILVKMRKIEACRKECISALVSWNMQRYLEVIHSSCLPSFSNLNQESAKYVTFHMAQSYALSTGVETYTKRDLVTLLPELESLIYFQGDGNNAIGEAQVAIMEKLESLWLAQTKRLSFSTVEKSTFLQSFYLSSNVESRVALNYLEADCDGSVLDMQAERLCLASLSLPILVSEVPSTSKLFHLALRYPPTWPNNITKLQYVEEARNPSSDYLLHLTRYLAHLEYSTNVIANTHVSAASAHSKKSKNKKTHDPLQHTPAIDAPTQKLFKTLTNKCEKGLSNCDLGSTILSFRAVEGTVQSLVVRSSLSLLVVPTDPQLLEEFA